MKGTDITPKVRREVQERDSFDGVPCCIYCGSSHGIQLAHYVSRGRGGKGIPENLVCLCTKCHRTLDNGSDSGERKAISNYVKYYLGSYYPGWDESNLIVSKYPKCDKDDCFAHSNGRCTALTNSEGCTFYKRRDD